MSTKLINLASYIPQTMALGPGLRAAIWVQGCPFSCPGCIVPEWHNSQPNQLVRVDELCEKILSIPAIEGITISGGEPIQQADVLSDFIYLIKQKKDLNIISFTGYTLENLINHLDRYPAVSRYLDLLDVLIDGPYIQVLDDNKGLRGSSNQKVHHLTNRLSHFDFDNCPRQAEFHIQNQTLALAGIPPKGILDVFNQLSLQISTTNFFEAGGL